MSGIRDDILDNWVGLVSEGDGVGEQLFEEGRLSKFLLYLRTDCHSVGIPYVAR